LISWKRKSTTHDTHPLRANWEPSETSCNVIYIFLFIRAKNFIVILLASASIGFKQCQSFTSLGYGHFWGVIYFTNNVLNLWHLPNTVLNVHKYYSLISIMFRYKCTIFVEHKMPCSKPTANDSYYSLGYAVCSSSVVDVNYVQKYNLNRFLKTYS